VNILEAINDEQIFGRAFADKATWAAWRAFLAALFGLPLTPEQLAVYQECTGRADPPSERATEAWLVCGRRSGKSFTLAVVAVFLACFFDWRPFLGIGERATLVVIAADRRQARTVMRYVKGLLYLVPMLKQLLEAERTESIDLNIRISIEVHTASFRTVRGYTVVAALLDELAFWLGDDSANPDTEIIAALKPAMSTVSGALLLCASSPYARRGALWESYHRHFGRDGPVLVWKAPTRTMNPTVPQSIIDEAFEADPISAAAEYLGEFRSDIAGFVPREAVEAVTNWGAHERPPINGRKYVAFVDPSGGSNDAMTLAIAHLENEIGVLDLLREVRPPFSPEGVVAEFADTLKRYRITSIKGDRYAGEWVKEPFRLRGIRYEPSDDPKSQLYLNLLPAINSGRVQLLGNKRLITQLTLLERRTARGGRDSIDHPPGAHDDLANAAAGALLAATTKKPGIKIGFGGPGKIYWPAEEERQHSRLIVDGRVIPPQPWGRR
jgi:hypothetical protein